MKRLKQLPEFVRFVMVGIFATALHYGLYFVLQRVINVNIAYTLGYALSFIANFYLTAYFTFGRKPSWRKAFGFGGAHLCSYLLHMGLLNLSRFFVKFGGNLFFISMVFLFFFLNPIKSCRYVCFLVTLKTPHH